MARKSKRKVVREDKKVAWIIGIVIASVIIISILKERLNCRATAIDISKKALNIAKFNAKIHHLENKIKFFSQFIKFRN